MSKITNLDDTCEGLLVLIGYMKEKFFRPAEIIARSHLSPGQFHALSALYRRGPLPMSEIAAELKISKQQLTPLIGKLIDNGMVIRRADSQDRRIIVIEISETGKDAFEHLKLKIKKNIIAKLANLPEEDLQELNNLLLRLRDILKGIT
ncbi:MAG: MarR family transcriptional regulator [Syntrophomonadaceae bacterium]|nr:MarR family transcriptional regulator [Syntrophomonadaceae bacterium]